MTRPCLPALAAVAPLAFAIPADACDCHAHVFGPFDAYPLADDRSYTPAAYPVDAFLAHLDAIGFARGVLVTGSASGKDNGSVIAALQAAPERLRGIVVPASDTSDDMLARWHAAGVRGIRANLFKRDGHAIYRNGIGLDVLEALAPRIAPLGWHAQVWIHAPDLPELAPRLLALGLPLVIDHMGRMNTDRGIDDPGFRKLCAMLREGQAWTKISGADRITVDGPPYQRHAGEVGAHRPKTERVVRPCPGADRRAPGHQHLTTGLQQSLGDDEILGGVGDTWNPSAQRMRAASTNRTRRAARCRPRRSLRA